MEEFVSAVNSIKWIDPLDCRRAVEERHSLPVAYQQYMRYFRRLEKLLGGGWYETRGLWRGPDVVERVKSLQHDGMLKGVEIGVDRGALSGYLLTELPTLQLGMVDTWGVFAEDSSYAKSGDGIVTRTQEQREEDLAEALRVTDHARDRRQILRMTSEEATRMFAPWESAVEEGSLDFVFLDADHSYAGIAADIQLWAPKVRSGGLLCGHDYGMEVFYPQWGVTRAVDEYAAKIGQTVQRGADWTWFIQV
jgi:DNA-binding Lrp family transcriptional regulator